MVRMQVVYVKPRERQVLGVWEVPAVPREGEGLEIEGWPYTVHAVDWSIVAGRLGAHVLVK